jgi:L-lactate dehydrogenase
MCDNSVLRIAIIGAREIGTAAGLALIWSAIANELLLVDIDTSLRDDRVRDLSDAACSLDSSTRVRAGTHLEAGQCDIVVITTGSGDIIPSMPWDSNLRRYNTEHWLLLSLGRANLEQANRNISTARNIVNAMRPISQDAIIVVLSNPIDLLTSLVVEFSGHPASNVLGYGTFLDTVRLRELIADSMGVRTNCFKKYIEKG